MKSGQMCIPSNYYQHNFSDTTGLATIFDKHKHGSNGCHKEESMLL